MTALRRQGFNLKISGAERHHRLMKGVRTPYFVNVKYAPLIDRSLYPGAVLREIRKRRVNFLGERQR